MSKDFENFKKFEEFFSNTKPDGILSWNRGNAFIELDVFRFIGKKVCKTSNCKYNAKK